MVTDVVEQLKQSLSGRPGVLGWDRFIHSSVLAPVVMVGGELHLLFQKRTEGIRQGGRSHFPAGGSTPAKTRTSNPQPCVSAVKRWGSHRSR